MRGSNYKPSPDEIVYWCKRAKELIDDLDYDGEHSWESNGIELAIEYIKNDEAKEYRTPKDVIKRTDMGTDGKPLNIYECPTCKRVIASREGWVYCRFCGQALRWPREDRDDKITD